MDGSVRSDVDSDHGATAAATEAATVAATATVADYGGATAPQRLRPSSPSSRSSSPSPRSSPSLSDSVCSRSRDGRRVKDWVRKHSLRTPPDFGQTRTPCDRAGLGSETRHGARRGKTVISRNSDINFVRELPGRKGYSLKPRSGHLH